MEPPKKIAFGLRRLFAKGGSVGYARSERVVLPGGALAKMSPGSSSLGRMDLTDSFNDVVPAELRQRYTWLETRNAAAVFKASNYAEFCELTNVLHNFSIYDSDILTPGGNRGPISIRIDKHFERLGWRAVRINMKATLIGKAKPSSLTRGQYLDEFLNSEVSNNGYEVDNMKRRAAIDVEWNGKDGALDRDMAAYRALYDLGLIDVACIITRDHESIKNLALNDLGSESAARRLGTITTTHIARLRDRMVRGDSGGCPVLAVGISRATWAGPGVLSPDAVEEAPLAEELQGATEATLDES